VPNITGRMEGEHFIPILTLHDLLREKYNFTLLSYVTLYFSIPANVLAYASVVYDKVGVSKKLHYIRISSLNTNKHVKGVKPKLIGRTMRSVVNWFGR
jgi:hypothetical protein